MSSLNEIAQYLTQNDNYVILTHRSPDGDTLGSAFALCRALRKIGKKARVAVNGELADKFRYLAEGMEEQSFECQGVIAVDIAAVSLLGDLAEEFADRVDVSIDHHGMNTPFAGMTYVDSGAAANVENVYKLLKVMNIEIDKGIADCLYTGLATDTGCFKFSNVTSDTMRIAADLIDCGCDNAYINRIMFDTKSFARIRIEQAALATLTMYCSGKIAVIHTTLAMEQETGASDSDMDGLAAVPRQIEGVTVGITIKERDNGAFKVSVRTLDGVNAAEICSTFGGGGHHAAGGCLVTGTLDEVKERLVKAAVRQLQEQ